MNIVEQLQAMGFRDEPVKLLYDGGDTDTVPGPGPGGSDLSSEISSVFGGTGAGPSIAGPMSPEDPEVLADYASGRIGYNWSSPQGKEVASILSQLQDMGYGKMEGINPKNPSQTIDNLVASYNVSNYGMPAVIAAIPGASALTNMAQFASNLASGKVSPGATLVDMAFETIANQFGVSKDTAIAMANGNHGRAAANVVNSALNTVLAETVGPLGAGMVNFGMNVSGANKAISNEIASSVNQATGATPTNNVGAMGRSIDQAFGITPGTSVLSAPAPEQLASSQALSPDIFGTLGGLGFEEQLSEEEKEKLKQLLEQSLPYETRG